MLLKATDIKKSYGNKFNRTEVLKGIDISLNKGEFVSIMGASGSGKTTLLNVLSSIDNVTSGHIYIDGIDFTTLKDKKLADFRKNDLGFIFQDYNLLDTLTIKENIMLPLSIRTMSKQEVEQQFDSVSRQLGIFDLAKKYPSQVSGGQAQRTSAARAFIHQPKIIFADEPTGALDSKSASDLLKKLQQLNNTLDTSIIMVTHDATAASFSHRVIFLKDGQVYTSLSRGEMTQDAYYSEILDTQRVLGGVVDEAE
ncbi:Bacitracin export ATP-binding protein BceA [Jeotgalicoccus aerolatus]|uniref:Bacitracin transport system ATP-binding protein n=2 Tax=Jeotgalicoccus aerolatus TaxID=709510 RepID=A0ABS4HNN5_9STAP|nr:ABC transporter ATP-binding protein [Jeotgalicoccus aerolatus]MBP1952552.1 bacitracin transport system ATP-binding protein [Jeotgalicoccus aerolatus]GGD92802.1 bacitracin export ATP-binding protein BceA [Jeotgalicoccus aerolatus]CAD2074501.1 Bacitracin export ATP-binding protein BceA [Jeotgalicoccus aerolatus]